MEVNNEKNDYVDQPLKVVTLPSVDNQKEVKIIGEGDLKVIVEDRENIRCHLFKSQDMLDRMVTFLNISYPGKKITAGDHINLVY
jgi:hypothetical protein